MGVTSRGAEAAERPAVASVNAPSTEPGLPWESHAHKREELPARITDTLKG